MEGGTLRPAGSRSPEFDLNPFEKPLRSLPAPSPLPAGGTAAPTRTAGPRAPVHEASASRAGCRAVAQGLDAVYPNLLYPGCELMGMLVGGVILDGLGIEDDDIRKIALAQFTAIF